MNRGMRWFVIMAGVSALVCGGMAVGQEREPLIEPTPKTKAQAQVQSQGAFVFGDPGQKPEAVLERAEDMEVLRQLLRDAVRREYAEDQLSVVGLGGEARAEISKEHILPDLIGPLAGHLPEYGLVYQLQAPPLYEPPQKKQPEPAEERKSLSKWERMRRQLRGEEVDSTATGEKVLKFARVEIRPAQRTPTKDELVARLLDLLAENGHHVRHLDAEERIAVAVTLRSGGTRQASAAHERYEQLVRLRDDALEAWRKAKAAVESGEGDQAKAAELRKRYFAAREEVQEALEALQSARSNGDNAEPTDGGFAGRGGSGRSGTGFGDRTEYGAMVSEPKSEHEVQGDLHLRQGDYSRAAHKYIAALTELLGERPTDTSPRTRITSKYNPQDPVQRRLFHKLVQAAVGMEKLETAESLLKQLAQAEERVEQPDRDRSAKDDSSQHIPLPARLVVSVTKADCDAVAAGEISREEFAQRAEVRFFDPKPLRKWGAPEKEESRQGESSEAEQD